MTPRRRIYLENPPGPRSGFYVFERKGRNETRVHFPGRGLTSVQDAAWVLDIHTTTLYRWIDAGEVRGVMQDEAIRIPNSELMRLLEERGAFDGDED